jgi:hypothetical protein
MTAKRSSTRVPFNVRGIALVASSHVVDDLYQGIVPALQTFLVYSPEFIKDTINVFNLAPKLV